MAGLKVISWLLLLLQCSEILCEGQTYIVDGDDYTTSTPARHTYQVLITGRDNVRKCTGVLIEPSWVLTSARCATLYGPHDLLIGVGKINLDDYTPENLKPPVDRKVFVHPSFNTRTYVNDLALIKIDTTGAEESVRYLKLVTYHQRQYYGQVATVSGWGKAFPASTSNYLTIKDVLIVDNNECRSPMDYPPTLYYKICTDGGYVCKEDIGGPLVWNGELIGVASGAANRNVCYISWCSQFTNVGLYKSWIYRTMSRN